MWIFLPCHPYQKLKRTYNILQPGKIIEDQFNQTADKIIENFKWSKNGNNYTYISQQEHTIKCIQVKHKKIKPFLDKFYLKGKDNLSQFKAYGYITCKNGQLFCCLLKIYKQKVKSGQLGGKEYLVYESTNIQRNGGMIGKWFYVNMQNSFRKWMLQSKQQSLASSKNLISDQPINLVYDSDKKINRSSAFTKSSQSL